MCFERYSKYLVNDHYLSCTGKQPKALIWAFIILPVAIIRHYVMLKHFAPIYQPMD